MARVEVSPGLIRWARERARLSADKLSGRFPKLSEWESGAAKPTLRQLEAFANATTTPLGYLFLAWGARAAHAVLWSQQVRAWRWSGPPPWQ